MNINKEFWENKKVFITGHTGFKGAWLCQLLFYMGAEVTGYALEPNEKSLYNILGMNNKVKSVIGEMNDLEHLQDSMLEAKPDIVFHLAAQPLVRESYNRPVYTYETNVMGTVNLLESIRNCHSVKSVVNVTTDKVYENMEWYWSYRENENLCGHDPYSNSKSCSELVTYSYKNSFFYDDDAPAISTARAGNVIGGGDFAEDRILPDCVRAAEQGQTIIVRNPYAIRPYQHVLDCLSGYLVLAQKQYEEKNKYEGNYNFGPDDKSCINTGKLVSLFCKSWGCQQKWESKSDSGPHEAQFLKLDCSKAKNILGWKPCWDIETAIDKTVEWSKAYLESKDISKYTENQIIEYLERH